MAALWLHEQFCCASIQFKREIIVHMSLWFSGKVTDHNRLMLDIRFVSAT